MLLGLFERRARVLFDAETAEERREQRDKARTIQKMRRDNSPSTEGAEGGTSWVVRLGTPAAVVAVGWILWRLRGP